jgi:hypothetical protein
MLTHHFRHWVLHPSSGDCYYSGIFFNVVLWYSWHIEQVSSSGDASRLYSRGAWFESWVGRLIYWQFSRDFAQSPGKFSGSNLIRSRSAAIHTPYGTLFTTGSIIWLSIQWVPGVFLGDKAARAWRWHLTSVQCQDQEHWRYTSTPPYVFMMWCLINYAHGQLYIFMVWISDSPVRNQSPFTTLTLISKVTRIRK